MMKQHVHGIARRYGRLAGRDVRYRTWFPGYVCLLILQCPPLFNSFKFFILWPSTNTSKVSKKHHNLT